MSAPAALSNRELISAVARKSGGPVAYTEMHEIQLDMKGLPVSARTEYLAPDGALMATLETDFKNGWAAADYAFKDARDGSSHGVEVKREGFLLWKSPKGGPREEKLIRKDRFSTKDLIVAGQGLFFHLRGNLKEFKKGESIPVKLLIPGRLDFYSFDLSLVAEDERVATFQMRSHSMLLRIFVPSFQFKFDKVSNGILDYTGPSNLADEKGALQTVEISYKYKPEAGVKPAESEKGSQ